MDYEKKNKDAISTIKQALRQLATNGVPVGNMIEAMKDIEEKYAESEDGRIRKWLVEEIYKSVNSSINKGFDIEMGGKALAWLEKQGEHANFRNKIQIGDKVTRNRDGYLVNLSQLNRVAKKQGEQKPAWSEEDEVKMNRIVACLENLNVADNDILLKDINWLKSLKDRYTWKPSDEQMAALSDINCTGCISYAGQGQELIDLYNDLKRLLKI